MAFRKWLSTAGGGGPQYLGEQANETWHDSMGRLRRRELLDRFSQHTQNCASCRQARDLALNSLKLETAVQGHPYSGWNLSFDACSYSGLPQNMLFCWKDISGLHANICNHSALHICVNSHC
jgi:hypothetical protein